LIKKMKRIIFIIYSFGHWDFGACLVFGNFYLEFLFGYLNLFRISDFELRIIY